MSLSHQKHDNKNHTVVLKIVILGDGGVGKSCLMNRFVSNQFAEQSIHTIGVEFLNKLIELDGILYTLQIWDTAGQERFKSLRTPFYRGSDICLLTYAIDDSDSFENLNTWKKEFIHYADVESDFPFLIVGNKLDLERNISIKEVETWCKENGNLPYVETSAKDATNVEEAFLLCVNQWKNSEKHQEKMPLPDTVQLEKSISNKICGCQ